jgi:Sigma-70 region 2
MDANEALAERFEEHRIRLRAVAYRMLGSLSEADDAVQEAWLRLSGTEAKDEALLTDSVGLALLVVLDALPSAERLAFVLHDMFVAPFDFLAAHFPERPRAGRRRSGARRPGGRSPHMPGTRSPGGRRTP